MRTTAGSACVAAAATIDTADARELSGRGGAGVGLDIEGPCGNTWIGVDGGVSVIAELSCRDASLI